jgi:hypothetical protein
MARDPSTRARARAREAAGNQRPWPADKVERWAIDRLIPYAKNARTHTDAQVACAVYAQANPNPDWLRLEMSNEEFADALVTEVQKAKPAGGTGFQSQGIGDIFNSLQNGITRLKEGAANWASRQALDAVRETLHGKVALFLGDVFTYLDERGTPQDPGAIVKKVAAALTEGLQARTDSDPLIVVGHSLGGVILYDMLTSFQPEANLVPGLHIDRLVTVGSQVGLVRGAEELPRLARGVQQEER